MSTKNETSLLGDISWDDVETNSEVSDNTSEVSEGLVADIDSSFFDSVSVVQEEPIIAEAEVPVVENTETPEATVETNEVVETPVTESLSSYNVFVNSLIEKGIIGDLTDDLELEDSIEGVGQLITREKETYFTNMLGSLSETTRKMVELELQGVDVEEVFDEVVDYSQLDLEDEDTKKNLLKDFYLISGISDEASLDIDSEVEDLEVSGRLEKELTKAVTFLTNQQAKELAQKETIALQKAELAKKEQELVAQKQYEDFKTKVTSIRNIKGIEVSQSDAEQLFNYMTVKDAKGKTQAEKDQTEEAWLFLEYAKMKKLDIASLNRAATTKAVKQIEKKLLRVAPKSLQDISVSKENTNKPVIGIPW
jgi:hypothetical protein